MGLPHTLWGARRGVGGGGEGMGMGGVMGLPHSDGADVGRPLSDVKGGGEGVPHKCGATHKCGVSPKCGATHKLRFGTQRDYGAPRK